MRPATHQLVDPFGNTHGVCEHCAAQSQIFGTLTKMLLPALMQPALPMLAACPHCKITWQRLNQTSHLGCPECYRHFREQLQPTLARLHGNTYHTGRRPRPAPDSRPQRERLREQLDHAVAEERFEDAAQLRDQLRALESGEA